MYYTDSHEWVKIDGEQGVLGITSHAQKELGEIVSIELPTVGVVVEQGDPICVLESTKAAVDVYAPISGQIVEVNPLLLESVDLLNTSSEQEGWLCRIQIKKQAPLDHLLSKKAYEATLL